LAHTVQKRNEPANLIVSARFIADTKSMSVEQVIEATTQNAIRLFPKLRTLLKV
jgi:TatD DNase family protein